MFTDKKLLKNIIINLTSNAIKFSGEGDAITLKSILRDNKTDIFITDKGIGISEEDKEHLFSSFYRGKNAMNIQGTGLGLHIVKRYLDLLDGTIDLQSKVDEGSTFKITIPITNNIQQP